MPSMFELRLQLAEALAYVRDKTRSRPGIGIILGSGLGPFVEEVEAVTEFSTSEIPHYPPSTVAGHAGRLIFGQLGGKELAVLQGRIHSYEGYPLAKVVFPVHLLAACGVKTLIVTNAAGGYNRNFVPGDLMVIEDHINMMFDNPLTGQNDDTIGPRFPDMSQPYSHKLTSLAEKAALDLGIPLKKGVLAASKGPTYETAAEVRMFSRFGADAGSMSTVPEVIVASYLGLEVLGISCITNAGTGLSDKKLSHEEVTEVAGRVKTTFSALLKEIIGRYKSE